MYGEVIVKNDCVLTSMCIIMWSVMVDRGILRSNALSWLSEIFPPNWIMSISIMLPGRFDKHKCLKHNWRACLKNIWSQFLASVSSWERFWRVSKFVKVSYLLRQIGILPRLSYLQGQLIYEMKIGKSKNMLTVVAIHDFRSPSRKGVSEFWEKTHWGVIYSNSV